jgi:hypothetical protein
LGSLLIAPFASAFESFFSTAVFATSLAAGSSSVGPTRCALASAAPAAHTSASAKADWRRTLLIMHSTSPAARRDPRRRAKASRVVMAEGAAELSERVGRADACTIRAPPD